MSPALRQSWGRCEASPALLRASASAGLPSPPPDKLRVLAAAPL